MLLENNDTKVIELLDNFDNLTNIDKLRLAINILENKQFSIDYNTNDMINILKEALSILDKEYAKSLINFSKYINLLFFSVEYLELTEKEKQFFTIEILFNIYQTDFNDNTINKKINKHLYVYDYCYSILNN